MTLPAGLELPVLQPRRKPHRYGPDNPPPGKGRRKGAINKITADLKQGILRGAANCGYDGAGLGGVDGFLLMCAQRHPKHYLALLGKMLPLNLSADVSTTAVNEVRIISVPADHFLSQADMERLQSHLPLTVEGQSLEYPPPEPIEQPDEPACFEEPAAAESALPEPEHDPVLKRAMEMGYTPLPRRVRPVD
jgi:hypothetical protein